MTDEPAVSSVRKKSLSLGSQTEHPCNFRDFFTNTAAALA